jgi:hypothetical protein
MNFSYSVQILKHRQHRRTGQELEPRWHEVGYYPSLKEAKANIPEMYRARIIKEYYEVVYEVDDE